MPLFGSISEIFAGLSPRGHQPANHQQPARRRDDSHSTRRTSLTPTNRIITAQNEFTLGSDSKSDDPHDHHSQPAHDSAASQITQSYANPSVSTPGTPTNSGQTRDLKSRFFIGSDRRLSDSLQMLSKDQRRPDAQDRHEEARLLGANYRNSNAVPIKPGETFQKHRKIPGSSAAFTPTDRISNSCGSGPVRAQGKSRKSNTHSLILDQTKLEGVNEFEDSNRPSKRQRREDVDTRHNHTHSIGVDPLSPVHQTSRFSPGSSSFSTKSKNNRSCNYQEEYRCVEETLRVKRNRQKMPSLRISDESQDELFTSQAARQRRSGVNIESRSPHKPVKMDQNRHAFLESVEIPPAMERFVEQEQASQPHMFSSMRIRREPDARESPDELQGDVTTRPLPKHSDRISKQIRQIGHKEQLVSPSRKRSPADIEPTDFVRSTRRGPKKVKRGPKIPISSSFDVHNLRFGAIKKPSMQGRRATLLMDQEKIVLGEEIVGPGESITVPLRNVITVVRGIFPSLKVRLKLSKNADALSDILDIEFLIQAEKNQFVQQLQEKQIKIIDKDMLFMDKAFGNHERELDKFDSRAKKPFLTTSNGEPAQLAPTNVPVRQKISDSLQDSTGEASESKCDTVNSKQENPQMGDASDRKRNSESAVEIPVKPFRKLKSPERETRLTRRSARLLDDQRDKSPGHFPKASLEDDAARKIWQKPLVYPPAGKKRAEVTVEDRDRLRDDEFLNDNLIGFYMRFLQDHLERTNQEAAKKVYFFNSYFFATLTNTSRGVRGINYTGVEKWTRSVDLFSYDYVVVPINQNAHWYVAIICNLPNLSMDSAEHSGQSSAHVSDREPSILPETEVQEIPESPKPEKSRAHAHHANFNSNYAPIERRASESPVSQETREGIASMTLKEKTQEPTSADEWPDAEETPAALKQSPFRKSKSAGAEKVRTESPSIGKANKKGVAKHKLDPLQTTIITFDSLDLARSPTIRILREYICMEAESKRGVKLSPGDIKGMRARQIPLQPNYSDCGLYLLAYVEKFVQDPDTFITMSLRREMDAHADWPALGSGLLRRRLRDFLDALYEEQEQEVDGKVLLAEKSPVSFLLGSSPSRESVDHQKSSTSGSLIGEEERGNPAASDRPSKKPQATAYPAEGSIQDEPQLVPTESVAESDSNEVGIGTRTTATKHSSPLHEEEVVQVPDSQEGMSSTDSSDRPISQPHRGERKDPSTIEGATTRKRSGGKMTAALVDTTNMDLCDSKSERPAKNPQVEIQVQATPPPGQLERVRKSPRGLTRKK